MRNAFINIKEEQTINIIYLFLIILLPFNLIPQNMQINFLGSVLGNKWCFYPVIFIFIYIINKYYKNQSVFINANKFCKILLVYLFVLLVSLIIGLYNYPYYDLVIHAPIKQIEKLPRVLDVLQSLNINVDENLLTYFWIIARVIKDMVLEVLFTFGVTYMIYSCYYTSWVEGFKILIKGLIISLSIIFFYNIIELFFLAGNITAKDILEIVNPYLHAVKLNGNWHPPLFWKNQMRSIFPEPSHYGIYIAFSMPFMWYLFIVSNKKIIKIMLFFAIMFFTFCLFLTQARTAVVLFLGEIFLLAILTVLVKVKRYNIVMIFACSMLAFWLSNIFIYSYIQPNKIINISVKISNNNIKKNINTQNERTRTDNNYKSIGDKTKNKKQITLNNEENKQITIKSNQLAEYFEKNLFSLGNFTQRSNDARYSIMIADFKIGLDHPLIGVGSGLRNAYIPDYLPEMAKDNGEVKMWIKNQKEKGILRSGFPKLGEYTSRFAETGISGLILFLVPPFILLRKLYFKITDKNMSVDNKLPYLFFTISLIGIMASGLGDNLNITYCYWVLLGLGYAMCFGKENDVKDNGDTGSRQEH